MKDLQNYVELIQIEEISSARDVKKVGVQYSYHYKTHLQTGLPDKLDPR